MHPNFEHLEGEDTEEIIGQLVDFVTRTGEEIAEEKEEQRSKTAELKFFIARSHGFQLGELEDRVNELLKSESLTKHESDFFQDHFFKEQQLNEEVSYVQIGTPEYDRHDHFIFYFNEDYLRIFTVERRKWTKQTVEKLLKYIPTLDRVFISSDDLVSMVREVDGDIDGFTAKYDTFYDERDMSIQLHGGKEKYLEEVEDMYGVQPTRLEFSKTNSPRVEATANLTGYGTVPRVAESGQDFGRATMMDVTEKYIQQDQENFEVEHAPRKLTYRDQQKIEEIPGEEVEETEPPTDSISDTSSDAIASDGGFSLEGYTTVELIENIPKREQKGPSFKELSESLQEDILDKKTRYNFSEWEEGNFFVFDEERAEPFEITLDGRNILLHAKATTTADSLSDFYSIIHNEFSTNYQVTKHSDKISI